MIEIVKNGWDKVYVIVCGNCDTTFTYQRGDTYTFESRRYVICPVCRNKKCAATLTEYVPERDGEFVEVGEDE